MLYRFLYRADNGYIISRKPYRLNHGAEMNKDQRKYEKALKVMLRVGEFEKSNGRLLRCDPDVSKLKFYPNAKDFLRR